jgi:hypothetical protein
VVTRRTARARQHVERVEHPAGDAGVELGHPGTVAVGASVPAEPRISGNQAARPLV